METLVVGACASDAAILHGESVPRRLRVRMGRRRARCGKSEGNHGRIAAVLLACPRPRALASIVRDWHTLLVEHHLLKRPLGKLLLLLLVRRLGKVALRILLVVGIVVLVRVRKRPLGMLRKLLQRLCRCRRLACRLGERRRVHRAAGKRCGHTPITY